VTVYLPQVQAHAPNTLLVQVNIQRKAQGMGPLEYHAGLTAAAQEWADHLRNTGEWKHADDWVERVTRHYPGWRAIGEIIGAGGNVSAIVDAWMGSTGHRANILSVLFRDAGVGYAAGGRYGEYWVVNFGSRR
jgi:uncharacterized protein YkwD